MDKVLENPEDYTSYAVAYENSKWGKYRLISPGQGATPAQTISTVLDDKLTL
jgi:hypothetical protein